MLSAELYHRDGRLYVCPRWLTEQGMPAASAPVQVLDAGASDEEIGQAVLGALAGNRAGLPADQSRRGNDDHPVLAAAGVRRMRAFAREAAHVHAGTVTDTLDAASEVELDAARRNRGAFDYLPGDPLASPPVPAALGAAVREAFTRCVPAAELVAGRGGAAPADQDAGAGGDTPVGFGPKTAWLAARGTDPATVARALGLAEPAPAPWDAGVARATTDDGPVFVTPPVDGWVLAVGAALGGWWPDEIAPRLGEVSRALGGGEVHYYVTHRVSDYAAWARADGGRASRVFAFADGEAHQVGFPDAAEQRLGIDLAERFPGEDDVFAVAGAWSLDPTALDDRGEPHGPGLLGGWPAA